MISKEEVRHIAQLARLGISKEEEEQFSRDLSEIIDYMKKLQEVDVSNVSPTSHSLELKNVFREDDVNITDSETVNHLIDSAPHKEERYIKVKSIFKEPSN